MRHEESEGWDCPDCDQYNGWTEAGDYNKQLDLTASADKRFVRQQEIDKAHTTNGLCLNCNLNQELKISQLARFPREGAELEEYRTHLEKVYRLCPECEDTVTGILAEQDRNLAGKLIEWRLENSRLSSSSLQQERTKRTGTVEPWLSLLVLVLVQDYSPLSVPGCLLNITTNFPSSTFPTSFFPHITVEESLVQLVSTWLPVLVLILVSVLTLLSTLHKRPLRSLLYMVLLCMMVAGRSPVVQLVLAVLGVLVCPRVSRPRHTPIKERKTACVLTQPAVRTGEELETRTQDLLSSSDGDLTVTPRTRAAPIRSTSEISFNHEFSTTAADNRDCDLSSLSIEDSLGSPSVRSASAFQLRSYSGSSSSNSLFSPSRPLLRPARLTSTSWVAGGYWTPPSQSPSSHHPALSRASSQSSGFISATPSLANFYQTPLQPTPSHSVFSEPLPGPLKLRRRTVEDSISDSSCVGPRSDTKEKSGVGAGWTFTVTITPTGILLAVSLIVNITMAVLWLSPSE